VGQEATMPATLGFKPTIRSFVGVALLACGAVVTAAQLWSAAPYFVEFLPIRAEDSLGSLLSVGMTSLHVLQSVAFDRAAVLSFASGFLLSFTALGNTLAGLALLLNSATDDERSFGLRHR
jgi:hypothetical protein